MIPWALNKYSMTTLAKEWDAMLRGKCNTQ